MVEHTALAQLAAAMSDEPAPIYQRVKQAIVSQIREGLWKANQRVPSESELVNELGVSRMTINRALRELTSEGFLVRMQGVGTFVAEMKGDTAMLEVHNIADEIAQRGHQHSAKILTIGQNKADPEQAAVLGLTTGQTLFHSLTAGEHIVEAVLPDARQRKHLSLDEHEPCLLIRRQTWSDTKIVTYARLLYPGSRYKLLGRFRGHG